MNNEYPLMLYRAGSSFEWNGLQLDALIVDDAGGEAAAIGWVRNEHLNPLDHDGDGFAGGSVAKSPPALSGKSKPALIEIAQSEGVTLEPGMKSADIRAAIELSREA